VPSAPEPFCGDEGPGGTTCILPAGHQHSHQWNLLPPASKLFPDPPPEAPEPEPAPADADAGWRKCLIADLDPTAHIASTLALREIRTVGQIADRLDAGKRIVGLAATEMQWLRDRVKNAREEALS
jgi:hypothetical protein